MPSRTTCHRGPVVDFRSIIVVSPVQISASESILGLLLSEFLILEIDKPSAPRLKYGPVEAARSREKVWTKDSVQSVGKPVEGIKKG